MLSRIWIWTEMLPLKYAAVRFLEGLVAGGLVAGGLAGMQQLAYQQVNGTVEWTAVITAFLTAAWHAGIKYQRVHGFMPPPGGVAPNPPAPPTADDWANDTGPRAAVKNPAPVGASLPTDMTQLMSVLPPNPPTPGSGWSHS